VRYDVLAKPLNPIMPQKVRILRQHFLPLMLGAILTLHQGNQSSLSETDRLVP